jgi:predicted patatin/cPLA2 family phospholipase
MKTALVLEGGGLRGAYTAGVCAWLVQEGFEFDVHIGISSGALHACSMAMKDVRLLHDMAVDYAVGSENFGWQAFFKEGTPVAYNRLFEQIIPISLQFDLDKLKSIPSLVEFGVYRLKIQKTIWMNQQDIDPKIKLLQAACTLPIAGRNVKVNGEWYMDGGVTTMIPVGRALWHQADRMFVVTTKPSNFVRKDNSPLVQVLLDLLYFKYKQLLKDFRNRRVVYYDEMATVDRLEKEGLAMHMRPTRDFGAKRFSANLEQLQGLYELGLQDCEARKEEIYAFFNRKINKD